MRLAGINAKTHTSDNDNFIEYTIRIPKSQIDQDRQIGIADEYTFHLDAFASIPLIPISLSNPLRKGRALFVSRLLNLLFCYVFSRETL